MGKTGTYIVAGLAALLLIVMMAVAVWGQAKDLSAQNQKEPIDLNFQNAEVRSVIRFLADYGQVNVVVAPAVQGNVTIALKSVTWQNALEIIGRTYDLAVVYEENGYIRVLPAADYRKESTEEKKHLQEENNLIDLETRIIRINNSTSSSIVDAVKSLLSGRGKATADQHTNSIILQELPDNIDKVMEYIAKLDQPPRQIRISAQLLEINSRNLSELGITWTTNATWSPSGGNPVDYSASQTPGTAASPTGVGSPNGQFTVGTSQNNWDLSAKIASLVSAGKGKIIAHPEITTIDNTEARIQMGSKVPIKSFDQSGNTVVTFQEVGTIMKVTAHITAENKILMHMIPERSTYEFDANGVIINTNNAETNVVVSNGQTAVIGGLTTQDETESESGLPVLKDIPVIGALFGYTKKERVNRDLVIFVTPTIVEDLASTEPSKP
jgi:type IV pilus assembly protein PilQ